MARSVTTIAVFAVLGYAGLCLALFVFQRSLIYQPRPFPQESLAQALPLAVDGRDILITVLERKGGKALIYFGGNAEVVPLSLPELVRDFPGRSLYLPHYRGYGGSAGSPSEAAFFADALAVYDMVRNSHDDIAVMGRSLGSGVATYLAAHRPVSRLVLVTPFDSLATVAAAHYPFFPVRLLLRDRFDSAFWAARVEAPTLLLAAGRDEIVSPESSGRLLAAFRPGVASLKVVAEAGHNDISLFPEFSRYIE
jgi:pimeloyl-ACP methyl ester carboxylesterase